MKFDELRKKKIVLFGAGKLAHRFLSAYGDRVRLAAVVDHSEGLQGKRLCEVLEHLPDCENGRRVIQSPSVLKGMEMEKTCVVMAVAVKHMEDVKAQLKRYGVQEPVDVHVLLEERSREIEALPVQKNKLAFLTYLHKSHDEAITEYLLHNFPAGTFDIVWITRNQAVQPCASIRVVEAEDDFSCMEEIGTAHIVFMNEGTCSIPYLKKAGQYYIQLKHWSSITLKTFSAMEMGLGKDEGFIENLKKGSELLDYAFVGSVFDEQTFQKGFLYDGPCIRVGSPRSDLLFRKGIYEEVRARLGIPQGVKLALYAPTFRRLWDSLDIIRSLDFAQMRAALRERFGGAWEILLRLHPTLVERSGELELPAFVHDVSHYDEGEELVAAADVMVSDYSSIIFESAFLYRPVFLYAPDKERYVREERDFLLDYDHLPFPTSATNEAFCASILQFDEEAYKTTLRAFFEHYGVHEDGHACERAAAFIMKLLGMDAEERDGSAK